MLTDAARTRDPVLPGTRVDLVWQVGDTWTSRPWAVLVDDAPVDLAAGWAVTATVARDGAVVCEWTTDPGGGAVLLGTADIDHGDRTVTTSTVTLTHNPAQSRAAGPFTRLPVRVRVAAPGGGEAWTIAWGTATAWPERVAR